MDVQCEGNLKCYIFTSSKILGGGGGGIKSNQSIQNNLKCNNLQ
jgi:hypothetical protein